MKTQEQDELRAFHLSALHAVTGYNYLTRKWLPREGPLFYAFIQALRSHCYYNPKTGETRTTCFPALATLAQECGVSKRTICRLIQRDSEGRFIHCSLERFIRVIPRRRYDAEGQRQVQTSNLYMVCMDDPPTPEDDALVAEKEAELRACQSGTQKAEPTCHTQSRDKTAHEIVSSKPFTSEYVSIDLHEEANAHHHPQKRRETETAGERESPKSNRIGAERSEDQFRRSSHPSMPLTEAQEAASSVICSLLQDYGDTNAGIGAKIILKALIDTHAPDEKLIDLAYLGRARLRRFQLRGGHVENKAGYFVNLMRSLAKEARRNHWDVARMEAADVKRHNKGLEG